MTKSRQSEFALEMAYVSKRFNQNWVLKDVDIKVRRGSIHSIVGHNGAGKSTLMKIALGAYEPTEGDVHIGGQRLTYSRPAEARTLGLGMVMQERSLITTMTGIDNLFLNAERLNAVGCVDVQRERAEVEGMAGQLGIKPSTLLLRVSNMSMIEQELIEIVRALRLGSEVLVLDEPTAPLGREEIAKLFGVLRAIAARGTGVVLITHHLAEVFAVSEEVTCLREGSVVMSCLTKETDMAGVISAMLGRRPWTHSQSHERHISGFESVATLAVRNLRLGTKLKDVSFDAFAGEVLGIVGLAGSGRSTVLRILCGDLRPSGGELQLFGKPYGPKSPADAIRNGVFLIPQDRAVRGLIMSKSMTENLMLVILRRLVSGLGFLRVDDGRRLARQMMKKLEIRASGVDQPVRELSGGNQQKVVLAKALTLSPRLLLLDEPTVGVDIATTREIITQVRRLAEKGATVLWVSSDLLEITQVSDRIIVVGEGVAGAAIRREEKDAFNEHALSATIQSRQLH
jgi:ABC-type sugar transport system ATPase subunit